MRKSDLRQLIREEIQRINEEAETLDQIKRKLDDLAGQIEFASKELDTSDPDVKKGLKGLQDTWDSLMRLMDMRRSLRMR